MADKSAIEWTDATWNPTTGCDQISPGCANCYAKTWAARGLGNFAGGRLFEDVRVHEDRLEARGFISSSGFGRLARSARSVRVRSGSPSGRAVTTAATPVVRTSLSGREP